MTSLFSCMTFHQLVLHCQVASFS